MNKLFGVLAVVCVLAGVVSAQDVRVLSVNERAQWPGATHEVSIDVGDLTTTATNTAQSFSVEILEKQSFAVVASVLDTAFQDTATNANNSLTLTVGDGSTADLYLASHELAVDGTEVFLKFGAAWDSGGRAVYTADGNAVFTVTPAAAYGVAAMDVGKVRVYVQIMDALTRLR